MSDVTPPRDRTINTSNRLVATTRSPARSSVSNSSEVGSMEGNTRGSSSSKPSATAGTAGTSSNVRKGTKRKSSTIAMSSSTTNNNNSNNSNNSSNKRSSSSNNTNNNNNGAVRRTRPGLVPKKKPLSAGVPPPEQQQQQEKAPVPPLPPQHAVTTVPSINTASCDNAAEWLNRPGTSTSAASCEEEYMQRASSSRGSAYVRVVDYAATAEQGIRRTMEDQHTMVTESNIPFFAVYDGHGGTQCAEYLRDHLHSLILSHPDVRSNPEKAIYDSIVTADSDFLQRSEEGSNESGSVCAVALILDDTLVVGNVGDCEAVLCRNGAPLVLTVKHTLQSNPAELERVRAAGGKVFHNRVGHPKFNPSVVSLAVSRAIGDAGFKLAEYTDGRPSGVIAEPNTVSVRLRGDSDEFIVIGCDGLWDVMSHEEVVDFCSRRLHSGEVAQTITDELSQAALNKGGTDNVTAMLVHLTRPKSSHSARREIVPETAVSVRNHDS